jgi:hypothetical protein
MKFIIRPEAPTKIYLIGEDNREVFVIDVYDGHTIKVSSGSSIIKDNKKLYGSSLSIVPTTSDKILISRIESL